MKAPIVIGRDHLDCGSVASPYRETESMLDGSDAIADWPLLNAMVNTASGASWVSIHHGGGVGIGRSIHAGQVTVADGTALAGEKIERVLTNDPGMGVIRHVDAGYDRADEVAEERGVRVPMREGERVTFAELWAELAPIGRDADTGGYRRRRVDAGGPRRRGVVPRAACASRGLTVETDSIGNHVAWWRPDPTRRDPRGRDRQPPRLRPGRRCLRRTARRRVRPRRAWTCSASGGFSPPRPLGVACSPRRRARVRHALPGFPARDRVSSTRHARWR